MNDLLRDVSRETLERLRRYEDLVVKWTPKINLVSRADRALIWNRHILDSVQLYQHAPAGWAQWLDLGSGGGFPGIVVAILAMGRDTPQTVTMIESDARKATFLRTALRETGVSGRVVNARIEEAAPIGADVISARALADLTSLLSLAAPHLSQGGTCLFAKGARWRDEVSEARSTWKFDLRAATSALDPDAAILSLKELSRA